MKKIQNELQIYEKKRTSSNSAHKKTQDRKECSPEQKIMKTIN